MINFYDYYSKPGLTNSWHQSLINDVLRLRITCKLAPIEHIIKKIPKYAFMYCLDVLQDRWPEAEPYFLKYPFFSYRYAKDIIKGRWEEAELAIMTDPGLAYGYSMNLVGGRWYEAEPYIMKDPDSAYSYARHVIQRRWPEAEPYIKLNNLWWKYYKNSFRIND